MPKAKKSDLGKLRVDLIPVKPLMEIARVLTYGAKKYGERNWEGGIGWSRIYAAIQRHLLAFWDGEDKDCESQLLHLAHAAAGCLFLLEYMRTHKKLDDRPNNHK